MNACGLSVDFVQCRPKVSIVCVSQAEAAPIVYVPLHTSLRLLYNLYARFEVAVTAATKPKLLKVQTGKGPKWGLY